MVLDTCIRLQADLNQINNCRERLQANPYSFNQLSQVISLAGNETRLKILFLLNMESRLCPCDLSDILGVSIPAISQHLRKLKDRNIVTSTKEGQTIFYSISESIRSLIQPFFDIIDQNTLATTSV